MEVKKLQNSYPASFSAIGKLSSEMDGLGIFGKSVLNETWNGHEANHWLSDPERKSKGGELGYEATIVIDDYIIFASFIAYYAPWGEREPQDMMKIAQGPGFTKMSEQDKDIYEAAWKQWLKNLENENIKGDQIYNQDNSDDEDVNKVPLSTIIPRKNGEEDEQYKDRIELIQGFSEALRSKYKEKGEVLSLTQITNDGVIDFIETKWDIIQKSYNEALIKIISENRINKAKKDNETLNDQNKDDKNEQDENIFKKVIYSS